MTLLLINPLQYKPEPADEDRDIDGRTLAQFDPMVWRGVGLMLLGFALLFIVAYLYLYQLGGWF